MLNNRTSAKVMNEQLGSKITNLCVACMDVGGTTPRMKEIERSRKPESRAMQEQLPRDSVAFLAQYLLVWGALILIILNPHLIRPDLC